VITLTDMALFGRRNVQVASVPVSPKELRDQRTAACPNCGVQLKKVPGAKTKCPDCGEYMFVRTDPRINARVVVTVEQADVIDLEWAKLNGTYDDIMHERHRLEQIRVRLGPGFSEADVQWGALNERTLEAVRDGRWYDYTTLRFEMGEHLRERGSLEHAGECYLAATYLELNGPQDDRFGERFRLDPDAWGIAVDSFRDICDCLELSYREGLEQLSKQAIHEEQSLKPPMSWEAAKEAILSHIDVDTY